MNFAKYKRDDVVAELDTEKRKSINKMDDESARRMIAEMMREQFKLWILDSPQEIKCLYYMNILNSS